jgi:hypothetical protein
MMELSATLKTAAAAVTAAGTIGGGAVVLDSRHAPMSVMSDIGVMEIFDLVEIAQRDGSEDWICRAIDEAIIALCSEDEDHYLCRDPEAAENIRKKAGCTDE